MNATTIQHFILFLAAAVFYGRVPVWAYLTAAIVLIELDQARSYADPWWAWFRLRDTWTDMAAGAVGIAFAYFAELWCGSLI